MSPYWSGWLMGLFVGVCMTVVVGSLIRTWRRR